MKIVNGSPRMLELSEVGVTPTEIRLGKDVRLVFANIILFVGITLPFIDSMPGSFTYYWGGAFVLALLTVFCIPDKRETYSSAMIEKLFIGDIDRVGTKGSGGSLAGAAVGGLVFGGAGAVVGAVSSGNKIEEFKTATIKFRNNEWAVVVANGLAENLEMKNLIKLAGNSNVCPI